MRACRCVFDCACVCVCDCVCVVYYDPEAVGLKKGACVCSLCV